MSDSGSTTNNSKAKLLVSKKHAAQVLDVCVRTVENLIAAQELDVLAIGRRRLIPWRSLEDFIKRDHPTR